MIAKDLPKRLRELRDNRRQQDVAQEIGISRAALAYYETGKRSPDAGVIYKLAKFYGVSSDYILGLSDAKTSDIRVKDISEKTGLSVQSILTLGYIKDHDRERRDIIELIISDAR